MRLAISLSIFLSLSLSVADAKPRRTADTRWMRDCIHERTGPHRGLTLPEATRLCKADLRAARAGERARKAIEACHQAVVDACVEGAEPDGSTSCEDEALEQAFRETCGAGTTTPSVSVSEVK